MSGADRGALGALVAYEQQAVFAYEVVLAKAPLSAAQRRTVKRFEAEAQQAAAALRRALRQVGGTPSPPPDPALAPPPRDPSARGFLRDLVSAEESVVHAAYTAIQGISESRHLRATAAFMAQAGRRLVVLRDLAGEPLLPRTFETGGA